MLFLRGAAGAFFFFMKRLFSLFLIFAVLCGCGSVEPEVVVTEETTDPQPAQVPSETVASGITYQLLVYSFCDSDGDGVGDFKGIESKLDYLSSMGVGALWLSPIHPATSYHGYNVEDYSSVNPDYGTEEDFVSLVTAAHAKDIKIYLDYVLNHTSSNHPWFKSAKASATSPYRDYYFFYADGSYQCVFDRTMPDLNYGPASSCEESPAFKDIASSADKWIGLGVDGFRLDAIKHIYDDATSDENPTFLKKFYDRCNASFKAAGHSDDIYMVGEHFSEATEVAPYYTGLPAFFEFSFWWRLSYAINNGVGKYFVSDIQSYQKAYSQYRSSYIEATKLSNHDEDRAASTLEKNLSKEKLAAAVLLTCSGEPYIYQGEELGYWGTKSGGDEYVRTPIMWTTSSSSLASAKLGSRIDKSMLTASISVESQSADKESLLSLYRTFGTLRTHYKALAKGSLDYCPTAASYEPLAAWYRSYDGQKILVVHNFSSSSVTASFASSDRLTSVVASNGSYKVSGSKLTLGAYSSVLFLQ